MTDRQDQQDRKDRKDQQGTRCPQCGTPRAADNTPACACTREASDALRDARTAQAAAAEDFDPLRIRPYVELEPYAEAEDGAPRGGAAAEGAAEATMTLRAVPAPPDSAAPGPATTGLNLFEHEGEQPDDGGQEGQEGAAEDPRRRARRRALFLSVAGAAVATVAVAGFASGLFSYETPTRDGAAPQELRESVPDATTTDAASAPPSAPHTSTPATSAPPSTSPTPTPSATTTASQSSAPASPTTSRSAQPTRTATLTGTADAGQPPQAPVLRRGDRGPEVTELQLRLRQLNLFYGNATGNFDNRTEDAVRTYQWARGIRADELGVYGAATRASLESETSQP